MSNAVPREAAQDKFWIVRPEPRHGNHPPRLFWTKEGCLLHVVKSEQSFPAIKLEIWHVDLGSYKIERLK